MVGTSCWRCASCRAAACGSPPAAGDNPAFVRSDSAAIDRSWPTQMNVFARGYLAEPELLRRPGFAGATRTTSASSPDRYHHESADGTLETSYQDGIDQPFNALRSNESARSRRRRSRDEPGASSRA